MYRSYFSVPKNLRAIFRFSFNMRTVESRSVSSNRPHRIVESLAVLFLLQDEEAEAYKREAERSREAADAAQDSLEAERQRLAASEARRKNDEKQGAAEAAVLREQLDNAVSAAQIDHGTIS